MKKSLLISVVFGIGVFTRSVFAAEISATLVVENMTCASCPYIVKESLAAIPGVISVEVSEETKSAVVLYDDAKTSPEALTKATTDAGYPSKIKS